MPVTVTVRILGPVTVERDGAAAELPGPTLRVLLGLLAVRRLSLIHI